jgi:hypothetical protein
MVESQASWISSNFPFVIVMAIPFLLGIAWIVVRLAWKRRFSLQELLLLVTFFACACGFALWIRYGRLMPIPAEDHEIEAIEELRSR